MTHAAKDGGTAEPPGGEQSQCYGSDRVIWHGLHSNGLKDGDGFIIFIRGKPVLRITKENRWKAFWIAMILGILVTLAADEVRDYARWAVNELLMLLKPYVAAAIERARELLRMYFRVRDWR